jgi:hypothetical protein
MRSIIKAGIRVFTIFIFLNLVATLANTLISYSSADFDIQIIVLIELIAGLLLGTALLWFLWIKADKVTHFLAGDVDDNVLNINILDPGTVIDLALKLLGFYFIFKTIPQIAGLAVYQTIISTQRTEYLTQQLYVGQVSSPYDAQRWTVQIVTLIIGIILVTGRGGFKIIGKGISNFWKYGNTSGPEPPEEQ